MRNLQQQVKKTFCCQKWFRLFAKWINCLNIFKVFLVTRTILFTVSQNKFGDKIPWLLSIFFLAFLNNYNPFNFHVQTMLPFIRDCISNIRNSSIFLRSTSRVQNNLHTAIKYWYIILFHKKYETGGKKQDISYCIAGLSGEMGFSYLSHIHYRTHPVST